jgi:hypothetical protein
MHATSRKRDEHRFATLPQLRNADHAEAIRGTYPVVQLIVG